jgi:hypothetical protein
LANPSTGSKDEGVNMVVVPLSQPARDSQAATRASESDSTHWIRYAAGGSLLAGGLLLVTGRHKAGMVAAASGTALALLDQQDTLHAWWRMLPVYIDDVQRLLGHVQVTVEEIANKRETLRQVFGR